MKKLLRTALAAAVLAAAGCSSSSTAGSDTADEGKDHLARIQEAGKLVIGLEGDWQPFSFHNDNDELVGFDVEVAKTIAEKLGVEAEIVESPWDTLFSGMTAGTFDMVVNGVDVTEDRSKTYDFTDPYGYDRTVLVVRSDEKEIAAFEDLKGKTTANSTGSTYMEIGESYGASVLGVDTLAETMSMVINGQADATINAETSVQDYLNVTGETKVKVIARSEDSTAYAIPLVKGEDNATLLEAVNKALEEMRADGTLAAISVKYFGSDLTNE